MLYAPLLCVNLLLEYVFLRTLWQTGFLTNFYAISSQGDLLSLAGNDIQIAISARIGFHWQGKIKEQPD